MAVESHAGVLHMTQNHLLIISHEHVHDVVDCKNAPAADVRVVVQRQPAKHRLLRAHVSATIVRVRAVNDRGTLSHLAVARPLDCARLLDRFKCWSEERGE